MTKLIDHFSSLFSVNLTYRTFLDLDQRPSANPISKSNLKVERLGKQTFRIHGELGAISSESNPGEYVGFAGLELDAHPLLIAKPSSEVGLSFYFKSVSPKFLQTLTVQIVTDKKCDEGDSGVEQYSYDFNLNKSDDTEILIHLKWSEFRKSFRGHLKEDEGFFNNSTITRVRFFLKRSKNYPSESNALPFDFTIIQPQMLN